jgi:hypothetical protein
VVFQEEYLKGLVQVSCKQLVIIFEWHSYIAYGEAIAQNREEQNKVVGMLETSAGVSQVGY